MMESEGYEYRENQWIISSSLSPIDQKIILRTLDGRGRCFIAGKAYKRGDIILREEPYAMVIPDHLQTTCAYCGNTPTTGQIYGISPEDPFRYCSQHCMSSDSIIHQTEAKAMRMARDLNISGGSDPCNLLIRIAAIRKHENKVQKSILLPVLGRSNIFEHLLTLEAASSSLSEEVTQDIYRVAQAMSNVIESCDMQLTVDEAYKLLLIIQCNAHRIKDMSKNDVALGLFPLTSMLNHSCHPNCFQSYYIDEGNQPHSLPSIVMRALCDIQIGEEICYNYIPLYQSTDIRQGQLFRAYSFTCNCLRCYSNSSHSFDERTDLYPVDNVISLPSQPQTASKMSPFECSTEVLTCHSLLQRAMMNQNKSAVISIIKKLTALCSNEEKVTSFHPCNEVLLTTYQTVSKGCEFLLGGRDQMKLKLQQWRQKELSSSLFHEMTTENKLNELKYLLICVGYSYLAVGAMLKYTRVRNDEIGELEELIGLCLFLLSELLVDLSNHSVSAEQQETNEKLLQLLTLSDPTIEQNTSEFINIMTVFVLICLKSVNYYYETDPRITELLYIASKYPFQYYRDDKCILLFETFLESSSESKFGPPVK